VIAIVNATSFDIVRHYAGFQARRKWSHPSGANGRPNNATRPGLPFSIVPMRVSGLPEGLRRPGTRRQREQQLVIFAAVQHVIECGAGKTGSGR
jgi:hypothetical protein